MKIAYILSSLANSGPIIVANELVKLMILHGHHVDVYYFDNKVDLDFPCPIHRISMKSSFCFNRYDIIHCHGLRPDVFVLFHKPLFCKTPVVTTIHSYMFLDHAYKYGKFLAQITARLVLTATYRDDKVILLSRDMLDYYKKYLPNKKLTFAYNTRSSNPNLMLNNIEEDELCLFKGSSPLLCSVSNINARKGLHQIIQVLPFLPNFKYCVVGDGEDKDYLENLAIKLGVNNRVLFVGSKKNIFPYLLNSDVFVMPSYSEGFPLAVLEAAAAGKPIVCSDISIFREIFDGDEVVRFELDNLMNLKNAIELAFNNRNVLGSKVHAKYLHLYSPESFYYRHIEIYCKLIKNNCND